MRARTLDPKNLNTLTNLGILYMQKGDKLESPDDELADLGLDLGEDEYNKAVEIFEEALKLDPKAPRSNFYLGTAPYKIGESKKRNPCQPPVNLSNQPAR